MMVPKRTLIKTSAWIKRSHAYTSSTTIVALLLDNLKGKKNNRKRFLVDALLHPFQRSAIIRVVQLFPVHILWESV